jgi:RNA polymerase sigma-70 factor (ECF subfamily)
VRSDRDEELRRVYRIHVRRVYAFFAYSVGSSQAEDLTSQTFERVVGSWERFDATKAGERTWILAIARNLLIDHYRREGARPTRSLDDEPALLERLVATADRMNSLIDAQSLAQWLNALNERDRTVLALRFAADLTTEEIATELELTTDNVHQIVSRSLRRLRELSTDRQPPRTS